MNIIENVRRAAFGTVVMREAEQVSPTRTVLPPNLIVMSRDSAREIMRSQGHADIAYAKSKTEPDRIYGIRIAYDDSLALGEFLPAFTPSN